MINLGLKLGFILKGLPSVASTFTNSKLRIVTLIIVCLSVGVEWYGRACGFNTTSDSIQYLSSAKSFQQEGKFLGDDGTYNPYWPPLFPVLLSMSSDPLQFLGWINILCKLVIGMVILYLANKFLISDFYKSSFLISAMLSVYVLMISVFVWTELIFMSLILVNLYFALNLQNRFYFLGLILTGFLVCIQRNAGLFWISGLSIWLLVDRDNPMLKNIGRTLIFFFVSTSGLWAWNIYNTFFLPADFTFYDRPYFEGLFANVALMMGSFARMFVPVQSGIIQVVFFVLVAAVVLYLIRPIHKNVLLIVVVVYATGFVVLGNLDANEMDRYLSVATPFIFLLAFMAIEQLSQIEVKWWRYGMMVVTILWMSYTVVRTAKNVKIWHDRSCFSDSTK